MNKKIIKKVKENTGMKGHYKITIRDAKTGKVKRVYHEDNIIPTVGRTMIANNLTNNSPTDTMRINYTALGDGNTAVANGDIALASEVYRKATASHTNANNIAYVTAFYTATEDNDTYYEAGLFSNGGAGVDSGVLFSRVLLNAPTGITKTVTETLTVDYTITIT